MRAFFNQDALLFSLAGVTSGKDHKYMPRGGNTSNQQAAYANHKDASAATKVLRKFTASLLSSRRSSVAPSKLSISIPRIAAPTEIASHCGGTSPLTAPTVLTMIAAAIPDSVPLKLTAPFVPAGTRLQLVIRRAFSAKACPTSLETVSAAASESAAANASNKTFLS